MLTKEEIKRKLKENPSWEPSEEASLDDWDLFDEVCEELNKKRSKTIGGNENYDNNDWEEDIFDD